MKDITKLLLLLTSAVQAPQASSALPRDDTAVIQDYNVPVFSSCEIQSGDQDVKLQEILTTTGLLAIRVPISNEDSNNKNRNGNHILQNLCHCDPQSMGKIPNGDSTILADGLTRRSTIATASRGQTPLALPQTDIDTFCGQGVYESLEKMRDYVSVAASETFIPALDRIIHKHTIDVVGSSSNPTVVETAVNRRQLLSTSDENGGYSTIASIFEDANHLEHFHLYSKNSSEKAPQDNEAKAVDSALDWHTDGGLFLAFIPGQYCHSDIDDNDDGSFRVAVPTGNNSKSVKEMKAVFPDSSANENEIVVAIMLGAGAQHWLNTPESLKLKATKHAVKMEGGDFRAWYGMMHLVPTHAIIEHLPIPRTFGEMKQSSVHSLSRTFGGSNENKSQKDVVIGCGHDDTSFDNAMQSSSSYRRLRHVSGQSACEGSGNYFCWLSCLETPDKDNDSHLNKNESLYCIDPSVLSSTGNLTEAVQKCSDPVSGKAGGVMNGACQNYWYPTVEGVKSYLHPNSDDSNANVDTKYCYGATAMYMQGFEWEGTTCVAYLFTSWVLSTRLAFIFACIGTVLLAMLTEMITSGRRKFLKRSFESMKAKLFMSALLYMVQVTMGYAVMLIIMTYSGPLVISVIVGLVIGHIVTNWNVTSSDEIQLGGSTPCCQYEGDRNNENDENNENDFHNNDEDEDLRTKRNSEKSEGTTLGECCDGEVVGDMNVV